MTHSNKIITFTTDFGNRDPYVGMMKGIVLTVNPEALLIDITNEIPAHDIIYASFMLSNVYGYFPPGTIHIAIVDPGVGAGRKNIAALTENYLFIGPDNGIFSVVFTKEKVLEIREITNSPFVTERVSSTFHGRDVLAPCAGHLSAGKEFSDVGPIVENIKYLKYPKLKINKNMMIGEVVSIDSFGNMITNISEQGFRSFVGKREFEIYFASERFNKIEKTYGNVPVGKLIAIFGSSGYLEISMNGGNASSYFMTTVGSTITIGRS